ncbi:MAG: choice-of-anchor I family protein [Cyanobacteria bacterium J06623_4]
MNPRFSKIGSFTSSTGSEIVTFDDARNVLYIVSGGTVIEAVSISDPTNPTLVGSIDITSNGLSNEEFASGANSIAYNNGLIAVAVENTTQTNNGAVVIIDIADFSQNNNTASSSNVKVLEVGSLPDMVTFTPDGTKVLVANEGEPDEGIDPEGSISIVDLSAGLANVTQADVATATFTSFNGTEAALRADGVRLFPDVAGSITVAQDLEPEYIAVSPDGSKAFVTLQENNAIAIVDIATATVESIKGLGLKDYSQPDSGLDASDRDDAINIQPQPISGLYMPDSIASFEADGDTYYVIANEGDDRGDADEDTRGDAIRLKDLAEVTSFGRTGITLDAALQTKLEAEVGDDFLADEKLGRLTISSIDGDTDGDGDIDELVAYGGRSFSVLDDSGNIIFDSGNQIALATAESTPNLFNANDGDVGEFDNRSDNKGAEPEAITTGVIDGKPYAFVGLERAGGGVLAYDLSNPSEPKFTQYFRSDDDIAPEGFSFIEAGDSPTGNPLLAVANEESNTVAIYEASLTDPVPPTTDPFTLQLLHLTDQEAGIPALDDAPRASAVLNALKDDFDNTLIVSAGDAIIPGLFASASEAVFGGEARADILIQNELGVQAIAFGNHEFDKGTGLLADLIGGEGDFPGAQFPYLSSNLILSTDSNLAEFVVEDDQAPLPNSIAATTVIDINGQQVGIVGATTPTLPSISSPGDVTVEPGDFDGTPTEAQLDALAFEIQTDVDELLEANPDLNKVVLLAHMQQISIEQALATRLKNVDIIVAGGSNTRLFDENDRPRDGDSDQGPYPIFSTDAAGNPIAIVNTDGNYKYIGQLVIDFDENGIIQPESYDANVSGAYATDAQGVADLNAESLVDPDIQSIVDDLRAEILSSEGNVFGVSDVFLNGTRGSVRTQETNLGNLTADANLAIAKETDPTVVLSIKNGGGIRDDIGRVVVPTGGTGGTQQLPTEAVTDGDGNIVKPAGGISETDIANTLRFNNGLTLLTITAQELVEVMEHSVAASSPDDSNTQGRFPQIAGMQFSFDLTKAAGDRVQSLVVLDENGDDADIVVRNSQLVGDPDREFRMVTLGFLAGGGDGYPFPDRNVVSLEKEDGDDRTGAATFAVDGSEQDALAEYLADNFATPETAFSEDDTGRVLDTRIQNLAFTQDTVIDADTGSSSDFTPSEDGSTLNITNLKGADGVELSLESVDVSNASDITIFKVNEDESLTEIGRFSILESGELPEEFNPTFTVENLNEGDNLKFEITEDGNTRSAIAAVDENGEVTLDFGSGTVLSLTADREGSGPNVVESNGGDDAAFLNFSTLSGESSSVQFTVYREAKFESIVGLFAIEEIDEVTGEVTIGGQTFTPGDEGFADAALQAAIDVQLSTRDGGASIFTATLENQLYGTYISVDNTGETYFSFPGANGGNDHIKLLGNNAIGFEDLPGLGDADYDDTVVVFDVL